MDKIDALCIVAGNKKIGHKINSVLRCTCKRIKFSDEASAPYEKYDKLSKEELVQMYLKLIFN